VGLDLIRRVRPVIPVPLMGIGGISTDNAQAEPPLREIS
jgi:thiamine monophosphate synthase